MDRKREEREDVIMIVVENIDKFAIDDFSTQTDICVVGV